MRDVWNFHASRIPFILSMAKSAAPKNKIAEPDLTPYAGRWVAIVRGAITGIGATEQDARLASKYQRPKEEPSVIFVPEALSKRD